MRRVLSLWRTSSPLSSICLLSAVEIVVLSSRGLPWRGEWAWTMDWAAGATVLTGPVVAGLAAYEAGRWRSALVGVVMPSARRRILGSLSPAIGPLLSGTLVYLLGTLTVLLITAVSSPTDNFEPQILLLGFLKLVAYVALGWAIGGRLQPIIGAVSALIIGYGLVLLASGDGAFSFLRIGGSTGPIAGMDVNNYAVLARSLLLVALAIACAVAVASQYSNTKSLRPIVVALAMTLAVGGATIVHRQGAEPYRLASSQDRICRGTTVQVCMLVGNTTQLDSWASQIERSVTILSSSGLQFPSKYEEPAPTAAGRNPSVGELFFDPGTVNTAPPNRVMIVETLSTPATCPGFAAEIPPTGAMNARYWLSHWMYHRIWPNMGGGEVDPTVVAWMTQTPTSQQDSWVRATLMNLKSCALEKLAIPVAS